MKPGIYKHYKGKLYEVIGIGKHTETLEEVVLYRALYDNHDLWVRPLSMFCESVTIDTITMPRFQYVQEQR
jgi:hypothetical protein